MLSFVLFRIRQEWDIMLDCRRKGIPQAAYLNNGFIDTNSILDKLEKNSPLIKKIALLNDKERSKFIFQLSGEHWTVSIFFELLFAYSLLITIAMDRFKFV